MKRALEGAEKKTEESLDIYNRIQRAEWSNKPLTELSSSPSPKSKNTGLKSSFVLIRLPRIKTLSSPRLQVQRPEGDKRDKIPIVCSSFPSCKVQSGQMLTDSAEFWWDRERERERDKGEDSSVCAEEREWTESQGEQPGEHDCVCCDLIPPLTLHTHTHTHHASLSQVSVYVRVNSLPAPLSVLHPVRTAPHLCVSVPPPHTHTHTSAKFHPQLTCVGLRVRQAPPSPLQPPPMALGKQKEWLQGKQLRFTQLCVCVEGGVVVLVWASNTHAYYAVCSACEGAPLPSFHRRCKVLVWSAFQRREPRPHGQPGQLCSHKQTTVAWWCSADGAKIMELRWWS